MSEFPVSEGLLALINTIPQPCALVKDARIIWANVVFQKLFSHHSRSGLEGRDALSLLPEFTPEGVKEILTRQHQPGIQTVAWKTYGALPGSGFYACEMLFNLFEASDGDNWIIWIIQDRTQDTVSDQFSTVIQALDADNPYHVTYISTLIEKWTGYKPEEFYKDRRLFTSLVHPEDESRVFQGLKSSAQSKTGLELTYRLLHKDGSYRWVHHQSLFKESGPNGPAHLFGILRDVTEEKEAELALTEARERYRMIFQKAPLGILCIDRQGYIIDCNRQLCELLDLSKGALIGINALTTDNLILRTIARQLLRGVDYHYEGPFPIGNFSAEIQVSIQSTPLLDNTGRILGGLCLFQDIRKRLALEQSLRQEMNFSRAVVETTGILVVITDIQGRIISVNKALLDLTELSEGNFVDQIVWEALAREKHREEFKQEFERLLLSMKAGPLEISCPTKSETQKIISWSFALLRGEAQGRDTVVLTGLDITARYMLEEHLRRGQKMEAVGRLAGGVAHEFNNQLTSILGYCQLMLKEVSPDSPLYRKLKKIEKAAKRSAETTKQLLAFSRKQHLQLEILDLNPVILEGVEVFKRFLARATVVQVDLCKDRLLVNADRSQIQQILLNLALNARDAMGDEGLLKIETSRVVLKGNELKDSALPLAPGPYARLVVEDNGQGMPPEVLEKAFEPFYTTKPVGKGAGLGLAMVYGTVKQCRGHVIIHSQVARGTRIEIFLPLVPEKEQETVQITKPIKAVPEARQILVVEDDLLARDTVASVLRKLGYDVLTAASGEEGLGLLNQMEKQPDILLTDVVLPGINGKILVTKAKEIFPELKVVYMSGYPRDILDVDKGEDADIPLLMKPFTMESLAKTLQQVLGTEK